MKLIHTLLTAVVSLGYTPTFATDFYSGNALDEEFADRSVSTDVVDYAPTGLTSTREVRTTDENDYPRQWGKGRSGVKRWGTTGVETGLCISTNPGIVFGLSETMTNWGSAADACPAGTWVCRIRDLPNSGTCNTARETGIPGIPDWMNCGGTFMTFPAEDQHTGWIDAIMFRHTGAGKPENNFAAFGSNPVCYNLPVWCCSDAPPP